MSRSVPVSSSSRRQDANSCSYGAAVMMDSSTLADECDFYKQAGFVPEVADSLWGKSFQDSDFSYNALYSSFSTQVPIPGEVNGIGLDRGGNSNDSAHYLRNRTNFSYYSTDTEKLMKQLDLNGAEGDLFRQSAFESWSPICNPFKVTPARGFEMGPDNECGSSSRMLSAFADDSFGAVGDGLLQPPPCTNSMLKPPLPETRSHPGTTSLKPSYSDILLKCSQSPVRSMPNVKIDQPTSKSKMTKTQVTGTCKPVDGGKYRLQSESNHKAKAAEDRNGFHVLDWKTSEGVGGLKGASEAAEQGDRMHGADEGTPRRQRLSSSTSTTSSNCSSKKGSSQIAEELVTTEQRNRKLAESVFYSPSRNRQRQNHSGSREKSEERFSKTVLNNDKANNLQKAQQSQKRPLHINNNLGSNWQGDHSATSSTSQLRSKIKNCKPRADEEEAESASQSTSLPASAAEAAKKAPPDVESKKSLQRSGVRATGSGQPSAPSRPEKSAKDTTKKRESRKKKDSNAYSDLIDRILAVMSSHLKYWGIVVCAFLFWLLNLVIDVFSMSAKLAWHLSKEAMDKSHIGFAIVKKKGSRILKKLLLKLGLAKLCPNPSSPANASDHTKEHNISLPTTGEEAMKRLFSCKGKDPYSILGVSPTSTDDDIKKYYRRQAFLVHPDKNCIPGAEEAFKILAHAFELIGEPEKRDQYDTKTMEARHAESEWQEFNDLLTKLHEKMQEAANTIKCTSCGNRHKRIRTDRPCYSARYCAACKIRHAAREGDIWAESSVLGFLWHYYACMDTAVFDITEWAACQSKNLKHLLANTHNVQYRIVSGKKTKPSPSPHEDIEAEFEDYLNAFYNRASSGEGFTPPPTAKQRQQDIRKKKNKKRK